MSRIGRKPVQVADKVKVDLDGRILKVSGPLGELTQTIPEGVGLEVDGKTAVVTAPPKTRENSGHRGLVRALLANMVCGVSKGYVRKLEINGVGYKAELNGNTLTLSLGYSHQIQYTLPKGVTAEVEKQTAVTLKGIDKQAVGQAAAQIRGFREPEPYKGKGVKYAEEHIRRKVGKAGAGAG